MSEITGAQSLVRSLEAAGADDIFGIPGGAILPAYDPLMDSSIRHILVRHEQGAGHAAQGYAAATGRVARLIDEVDLTASVPACPEWCVADLVEHLGSVHQWARHAVLEGTPEGRPEDAPADLSELAAWYAGHAGDLVETLATTDPAAPAWTFGRGVGTAGWWARRQTHEVSIHTYDLLSAAGREEEWQPDPVLAWDGVREVQDTFYLRQVKMARTEPLAGTLVLEATDVPGGADPVRIGDGEPHVHLRGTARELLLLLWHRATTDDPAAAPLLAEAITP